MSTLLRIERGKRPQAGRNLRGRAREIGADRLPALAAVQRLEDDVRTQVEHARVDRREHHGHGADRKSTRLNSSHSQISYAVFCLKKKKTTICRATTASSNAVHTH